MDFGLPLFAVATFLWTSSNATAADAYVPFEGEKTTWHEGFDRYDFIMDDATGVITPMTAPASEVASFGIDVNIVDGKRRGVVIVPKKAAPGNPWSWQACYWDHQPQTEVELLRRGFHIAFIAPDPGRQGKAWDRWYRFLTEEHGLAKKAAFIGMSKGGVNAFNWGGANPDKVAAIYADNPAVYDDDFVKIPVLAQHDIPLLHVVGTEDFVLPYTMAIEEMYHQLGGSITVIMKEGHAHHPHSLIDPTPIADWIEQHMEPVEANRPAFADTTYTKTHYYSLESSYVHLEKEDTYATVRGPGYVPSYDRYTSPGTGTFHEDAMSIVVPQKPAPGKPWVFHPSFLERDSAVALAAASRGLPHRIAANLRIGGRTGEVGRGLSTDGRERIFKEGRNGGDRGEGWRVVRVGNREPGQGLGDLRPQSAARQQDVEDVAHRQPGAAGQGGGANSARLRESRPVAE